MSKNRVEYQGPNTLIVDGTHKFRKVEPAQMPLEFYAEQKRFSTVEKPIIVVVECWRGEDGDIDAFCQSKASLLNYLEMIETPEAIPNKEVRDTFLLLREHWLAHDPNALTIIKKLKTMAETTNFETHYLLVVYSDEYRPPHFGRFCR